MPFAPATSPAARHAIDAAFKNLEKTVAPGDARGFKDTTLAQVRDAALAIESRLAARGSLRNMMRLMPLFTGLEHYAHVMEVLCNGTPYLPWLWAPITLVLRVASEYVEAFEVLTKAYARLAEALPRIRVLGQAFPRDAAFQETLAVYYADILAFHGQAYRFVHRSSWKLFFLTSWGRFQRRFDALLENMQRHERLVDWEANARDIAASQALREELRDWRRESDARLAAAEHETAARQFAALLSWLKADDADQLAVFETLAVEGARFPGTCSWLLQHTLIKAWLRHSAEGSLMLLKGPPGAGKSVLAAQLVAFMRTASMPVACHVCTYAYTGSTTYDQVLRSLLLQLLRSDQELVAHVYAEYVLARSVPTVAVLQKLLKNLVGNLSSGEPGQPSQSGQVWIVIDGLDECNPSTQALVISLLRQLAATSACKVLIASRTTPTITERLRRVTVVSLAGEREKALLAGAIRHYARGRLEALHDRLGQLDVGPPELEALVAVIATKADGMFLYARLVLDYIASNLFYTRQELFDSVSMLPAELASFYRSVFLRMLNNLDARSVDRVRCILGWVAFAKRPLKKLEFMSAVTFSQGNPAVDRLVPRFNLDATATLVEERHDTTISFIHVSVKDFLQRDDSPIVVSEPLAIREHGISTVTCLLAGVALFRDTRSEHDRFMRLVEGLHGFHIYATEYWLEYLFGYVATLSNGSTDSDDAPSPLSLALQLASHMAEQTTRSADTTDTLFPPKPIKDERLVLLEPYPLLYQCAVTHIHARSLDGLEIVLVGPATSMSTPTQSIASILAFYQATLAGLLNQPDLPGIAAVDFEHVKRQFRSALYTCRLAGCPRATLGFDSDKLRREHEFAHLRHFPCTAANCQYPPFSTAAALKRHIAKYHCPDVPRRSIRYRVPAKRKPLAVNSGPGAPFSTGVDKSEPFFPAKRKPLAVNSDPGAPSSTGVDKSDPFYDDFLDDDFDMADFLDDILSGDDVSTASSPILDSTLIPPTFTSTPPMSNYYDPTIEPNLLPMPMSTRFTHHNYLPPIGNSHSSENSNLATMSRSQHQGAPQEAEPLMFHQARLLGSSRATERPMNKEAYDDIRDSSTIPVSVATLSLSPLTRAPPRPMDNIPGEMKEPATHASELQPVPLSRSNSPWVYKPTTDNNSQQQ